MSERPVTRLRHRAAVGLAVAATLGTAITVGVLATGSSRSPTSAGKPPATVTQKPPYGDPNSHSVISYGPGFTSAPYVGGAVKLTAAEAVAALNRNVSQGLGELAPGKPRVALRLVTYNSAGSASPEHGVTSAVDVTNLPVYVIVYNTSPPMRIGGLGVRTPPASDPVTTSTSPPMCSFEGLVDADSGKVLTLNQDCG